MKKKHTEIDVEKAKAMIKLYNSSGGKHPDGVLTKSVWFDLEIFKKLIKDIEESSGGNDVPGLRFYFGTYPESEPHTTINGKSVDYKYRNTLIIIPTKQEVVKGEIINQEYGSPENQGELCPEECGGGGLGG